MQGRDFLRTTDVTADELPRVLDLAARTKEQPELLAGALAGRTAALVFEKPSLRTKSSFSVGAARLGMATTYFGREEIGLGKRESIADAGGVLSRYYDLIIHRTFDQAHVDALADAADVPVINALSDHEHPCQLLADLQTLREHHGALDGLSVAYVGDGNNTCHSLILGAALTGIELRVATPPSHEPLEAVVQQALDLKGSVTLHPSPTEAVDGADAVYTDAWTSMGQEAEAEKRRAIFADFRVDSALMARAASRAVFMHCLPAHRGEEVTDDVLDSERSAVLDQAENRLHVQLALMALLLGGADLPA